MQNVVFHVAIAWRTLQLKFIGWQWFSFKSEMLMSKIWNSSLLYIDLFWQQVFEMLARILGSCLKFTSVVAVKAGAGTLAGLILTASILFKGLILLYTAIVWLGGLIVDGIRRDLNDPNSKIKKFGMTILRFLGRTIIYFGTLIGIIYFFAINVYFIVGLLLPILAFQVLFSWLGSKTNNLWQSIFNQIFENLFSLIGKFTNWWITGSAGND